MSAFRFRRLPVDAIAWPAAQQTVPDVAKIVERVRGEGDAAVADVAQQFGDPQPRRVADGELVAAYESLDPAIRNALSSAAQRIERFALLQRGCSSDFDIESDGLQMGHRFVPLDCAGIYVPGGRYPLPSTLLMGTIPARVAGVRRIVVCSPSISPEMLAAAYIAGVDDFFCIGGAQAIAAMAFGTQSVPRVDLIAGPGNVYVTAAKRLVYGTCAIDSLAGPSELAVVASGDADSALVAADLLAQAEHDDLARVMLLTDDEPFVAAVEREIEQRLERLTTRTTAATSLAGQGCCAILPLAAAIAAVNRLAPEHLELQGTRAQELASEARNYGALFVGSGAAEVFGDYGSGPNHILPTAGSARFTSGLSVFTFLMVRSFTRALTAPDEELVRQTEILAACEGLDGHRTAAALRAQVIAR